MALFVKCHFNRHIDITLHYITLNLVNTTALLSLRRSYVHHSQLHEMLMKLEPPLGFGRKCPYRLAYRVSFSFGLELGHCRSLPVAEISPIIKVVATLLLWYLRWH